MKHTQPLSIDAPGSAHAGSAHGGSANGGGAASALVDGLAGPSGDPYEAVRGREIEAALEAALGELDEEAREVLLLRDAEALSYEDIAAILDVPVGTIRSRLHRARSDLHRRMAPVLGGQPTDGVPGGEHRP